MVMVGRKVATRRSRELLLEGISQKVTGCSGRDHDDDLPYREGVAGAVGAERVQEVSLDAAPAVAENELGLISSLFSFAASRHSLRF